MMWLSAAKAFFLGGRMWLLWILAGTIALGSAYGYGRWDGRAVCNGRLADLRTEYDAARDAAVAAANTRYQNLVAYFAEVDARYSKERADAQTANDRLRADVAAGRKRLLVNAVCPAAAGVPAAAADPGGPAAARPELTPDAREGYHDLRREAGEVTDQRNKCVALLLKERGGGQ